MEMIFVSARQHFIDHSWIVCLFNAEEVDMYSDPSGNYGLGFGAYCGPEWTCGQWDEDFCRSFQPSIEYLELFAVLVGVLNWIWLFANRRVVLFCDNEAVVHMINKNTSGCRQCMVLMHLLVAESISRNVRVYAKHVGTKENGKADALSRLDYKRFKQLAGNTMNQQQTAIPKEIWPMKKYGKFNVFNFLSSFSARRHKKRSKSIGTSRISTDSIELIVQKLQMKQHRDSTAKTYLAIWRKFNDFVINLDRKPKLWEDRATLFIGYLIDNGMQSNTVKSYVSAIKKTLIMDGYNWNDNLVLVRSLANACKIINDTVRTRLPIQCSLLEMILFEIQRYFSPLNQYYLELLYKMIFALCYYGLMRVGEVTKSQHVLKAKDVHIAQNKDKILLVLYSSKTHTKGSRPQKIKITSNRNEKSGSCTSLFLSIQPDEDISKPQRGLPG